MPTVTPRAVRKAVLPAAGHGTRFLPASKAMPKEMATVVDRPAIQYVVEEAVRAGLVDVLLVTSEGKQAVEDHFDRDAGLEQALRAKGKTALLDEMLALSDLARIHSVRQLEPLGLGHAVLQARHHVGDEPFGVLLPDHLMDPGETLLERMVEVYGREQRGVIAVSRVPSDQVHLYGIVDATPTDRDGVYEVRDLVEKPRPEDAPSDLAIVGRYVLPPAVFDALERTDPGSGGEIQLTDGLRLLAAEAPLLAVEFDGHHDVGDKLGFLKATVALAADRPDLGPALLEWLAEFLTARKELQ